MLCVPMPMVAAFYYAIEFGFTAGRCNDCLGRAPRFEHMGPTHDDTAGRRAPGAATPNEIGVRPHSKATVIALIFELEHHIESAEQVTSPSLQLPERPLGRVTHSATHLLHSKSDIEPVLCQIVAFSGERAKLSRLNCWKELLVIWLFLIALGTWAIKRSGLTSKSELTISA